MESNKWFLHSNESESGGRPYYSSRTYIKPSISNWIGPIQPNWWPSNLWTGHSRRPKRIRYVKSHFCSLYKPIVPVIKPFILPKYPTRTFKMLLEILNCQLWCNLLHRYIVDFFKTKSNIVNYDIVYYIYCAVRIFHREISCAASRSERVVLALLYLLPANQKSIWFAVPTFIQIMSMIQFTTSFQS